MTARTHKTNNGRGLEECRAALELHYAAYNTIPSMAGLARLWNYASKSSASRRIHELIKAQVLVWSPDRRLAPGPAFGMGPDASPASDEVEEADGPDQLPAALAVWATGYDPALARSYAITTRLLRLARSMERYMAMSAATEGLTSGDVLLLDALYRVGPPHRIAPTALKHYFLMSLAGVAKRVERLQAAGFIERVANLDDRRGQFIQMTAAGQAALARLVEADRVSPNIVWPTSLSEAQFAVMQESLAIAEELVAASDKKERTFPLDPALGSI